MGHIGHGKSTLIGYLLSGLAIIDSREFLRIREEAMRLKREDKIFAFILDRRSDERQRGVTITPFYRSFSVGKHNFTVVDCPGHRDFVRNMILGTTQTDVGILVIAANDYENALRSYKRPKKHDRWVLGQAREHAYIAKFLEVKNLVVVINKMDLVNWSQQGYENARKEVADFLTQIGYMPRSLTFLPTAALYGDNVIVPSIRLRWYKGPTFLDALRGISEPARLVDFPLRMPIERFFFGVPGAATIACGKIQTGRVKSGETILLQPSLLAGEVRSIRIRNEGLQDKSVWIEMSKARAGNNVCLNLQVDRQNRHKMSTGQVISHKENPPSIANRFIGEVYILWHPTTIKAGYSPSFYAGTASSSCEFAELIEKVDAKTRINTSKPDCLEAGDIAKVQFRLSHPIVLEEFQTMPGLGRFIIRDYGITVGGGRVSKVIL